MVFLGEYPSLCVRTMHAVRTQCARSAHAVQTLSHSSSFLNNVMRLKDQLPFLPDRIGQVDRLLGSMSRSETYDAWVIRTSHQSKSESASVIYKMINLRQPGESADGVLFREPDIKYQVLVLQYAVSWEDQLLASISKSREEVDIVPGSDAQASKFVFVELDYGQASRLVEEFGRYPRFAILPLPWHTGAAVQKSARRREVSMFAAFRDKHLKFFFSYVLAAFWELGELFSGKDVAVHIVHSKRIRVGLSKKAYEHACAKKDEWYTEMGLELLDEQTGLKLSGSVGTSTQASSVPEAWGPCESVYLTNVPPYWRSDVLQEVLMTQGTGQKDFVLDKCRFHLGDIRTKTWMVTGPSTSGLLGKVLQASSSNTLIVPISSKEYNSKKAQIQGKGKGRGKGMGGGGGGGGTV